MIVDHDRDAQILAGDTHDLTSLTGKQTAVLDDVESSVGVHLLSESVGSEADEVLVRKGRGWIFCDGEWCSNLGDNGCGNDGGVITRGTALK